MHPKEFKKVKNNTGHFTHQSLKNSELFIGVDFTHHNRVNEIIATHESYILFPGESALNITQKNPHTGQKKNLAVFIIDSTWNCTKKMFTQSKNLQCLKHISFETSRESQYKIKVQPQSNYLSTIESTLVVLENLNRWQVEKITNDKLEGFLNPFVAMVRYQEEKIATTPSNSIRFKRYS